ncbi:hypothetical protein J1N35_042576 [Gossypium stocksii]|uniref:DC1 domain-containing protein n=1 Tax=Gossypium stocksii TaxID=47602 RepID=A0A9D3U5T2_9ROSI|nr:hypothetical protein J1N35_042576 [Gossypium stocksii]
MMLSHLLASTWLHGCMHVATIVATFKQDIMLSMHMENEDDKSLDIPVNSITKVLERNDAGEATTACSNVDPAGAFSNGFSYKCNECGEAVCLRCFALWLQDAVKIPGHRHPLCFYYDYWGQCRTCGTDLYGAFLCKGCNFDLCTPCVMRPTRVRHKCDEHILALSYDKVHDYVKYHYCDICEKKSDPKQWFYHCETCDTSVHVDCVFEKYSLIKLGSTYNEGNHEYPLTFFKKIHYYPECVKCGKPCE